MYSDSIYQWNVFKGCFFECKYCKRSFQAIERFRKNICSDCFNYKPHFHEERLKAKFPQTIGDQFIFVAASGDISFCKEEWFRKIIKIIEENSDKTFLLQSKMPSWFSFHEPFPENAILGITLESNRDYPQISGAPLQSERINWFNSEILEHSRKFVTIEPILDFDPFPFLKALNDIDPERIYIGYDTKKCGLNEPSINKTREFIKLLKLNKNWKVKRKFIPGAI